MPKLRNDEDVKAYGRLMKPSHVVGSTPQWHSAAAPADLVPSGIGSKTEDDEVSYADVNRQLALIFNVLLSIVACGAALWMAASHWSVPKRLALSMVGSVLVGVAEVVVYAGYLRRVQDAKQRSKQKPETKEIVETWVIEKRIEPKKTPLVPIPEQSQTDQSLRKRPETRVLPTHGA